MIIVPDLIKRKTCFVQTAFERKVRFLVHCNFVTFIVVCRLLQVAAAHGPQLIHFHPSTPRKRQIFVRACVKLLMSCASRYKVLLSKRELAFRAAVNKLLNDTEAVVLASMYVLSCLLITFSSFFNELLALKLLKIMPLLHTLLPLILPY
jgi:hypothetical protein